MLPAISSKLLSLNRGFFGWPIFCVQIWLLDNFYVSVGELLLIVEALVDDLVTSGAIEKEVAIVYFVVLFRFFGILVNLVGFGWCLIVTLVNFWDIWRIDIGIFLLILITMWHHRIINHLHHFMINLRFLQILIRIIHRISINGLKLISYWHFPLLTLKHNLVNFI